MQSEVGQTSEEGAVVAAPAMARGHTSRELRFSKTFTRLEHSHHDTGSFPSTSQSKKACNPCLFREKPATTGLFTCIALKPPELTTFKHPLPWHWATVPTNSHRLPPICPSETVPIQHSTQPLSPVPRTPPRHLGNSKGKITLHFVVEY